MDPQEPTQPSRHRTSPRFLQRARELRQDAPVPERILWHYLRSGRLGGLKFRRQQPIGPYVVDYFCAEARLIIELDGMSHVGDEDRDEARQRWLEAQGLRVLRFTNDEVIAVAEAVALAIAREAGLNW